MGERVSNRPIDPTLLDEMTGEDEKRKAMIALPTEAVTRTPNAPRLIIYRHSPTSRSRYSTGFRFQYVAELLHIRLVSAPPHPSEQWTQEPVNTGRFNIGYESELSSALYSLE